MNLYHFREFHMEDLKLFNLCKKCSKPLTLMESCRGEFSDNSNNSYLVIRCLNCGQHPIEEIVRLDKDQSNLYKGE